MLSELLKVARFVGRDFVFGVAGGVILFEWNWYTIVALALGGFAMYVLLQSRFRGPERELDKRMEEFAKQAVEIAYAEHQCVLDYGLESIRLVDGILLKIHARHLSETIQERELSRIVLTWGGYVGVVLARRLGGVWATDSATAGPNTYPLQFQGFEAVPVIWCLKQIRLGAEASVALKIEAWVKQIKE